MPAPSLPKRKFAEHHTENVGTRAATSWAGKNAVAPERRMRTRCHRVDLSARYAAVSSCSAKSPKSSISHSR